MKIRSRMFPGIALVSMLGASACNGTQQAGTQEPYEGEYEAQGPQPQYEAQGPQQPQPQPPGQPGQQERQPEQKQPQPGQRTQGTAALDTVDKEPYGAFIADKDGRALYGFTPDKKTGQSSCYEACAEAWPPLLTEGDPRVQAPNLDPELLGTIERKDGSKQVTYGGWPLYYYVKDDGPRVVKGQDVQGFGGEWYLLSPRGEKIGESGKHTPKP